MYKSEITSFQNGNFFSFLSKKKNILYSEDDLQNIFTCPMSIMALFLSAQKNMAVFIVAADMKIVI